MHLSWQPKGNHAWEKFMICSEIEREGNKNGKKGNKNEKKKLTKINGILTSDSCKYLLSFSRIMSPSIFVEYVDNLFPVLKCRSAFSNSIHDISTRASALQNTASYLQRFNGKGKTHNVYISTAFNFNREKHYDNKQLEHLVYPIDRRRNGGAKPRNIEVSRDKSPFSENNGITIEKPITK